MKRFVLMAMVFAVIGACKQSKTTDIAAARRSIDSVNAKVEGWYAANQPDSVASVFARDAWLMPPNDAPVIGQDSIRAFWRNALGMGKWAFDLRTEDVIATDSVRVERGQFTLKFTPAANAPIPAFDDRGNYVTVWRRESDGNWRIAWDAAVSSLRRDGPPAVDTTSAPSGS